MELFFLPCTRTIHGRNVDCAAAKHRANHKSVPVVPLRAGLQFRSYIWSQLNIAAHLHVIVPWIYSGRTGCIAT